VLTQRRLLFAGTLGLVLVECLLFLYLVVVGWAFRSMLLPPGDPEIAVRTRTVAANSVWLAINLVGLLAFAYRRRDFGRPLILAVLAFDTVNSVLAGIEFILRSDSSTAIQWWLLSVVPALALVLVLLQMRQAQASP
jgi:hypothetical protein